MQTEIEQAELKLAQDKQRRLIVFGRQHLVQHGLWQRFAGFVVTGDKRQRFRLPTPVFHKLAREFDGIPWHTANASYPCGIDLRQHMMQAVTKFMEQRGDFIVGEQRGFTVDWTVKITYQIGHRFLQFTVAFAQASRTVIHPGTATLVFARIEIEIETAAQFAVFIKQVKETYFGVPYVYVVALFGCDAVNALHHFKQPFNHALFWEIRAQLLITDGVEVLFLQFAVVSDVPRLQFASVIMRFGEGAQLCQFRFPCGRARVARSLRKSSTCCGFSAILVARDLSAKLSKPNSCASSWRSASSSAITSLLSHLPAFGP